MWRSECVFLPPETREENRKHEKAAAGDGDCSGRRFSIRDYHREADRTAEGSSYSPQSPYAPQIQTDSTVRQRRPARSIIFIQVCCCRMFAVSSPDMGTVTLDLFLFAGDAPAQILDLYTQLTGRAAGVPRWSLGLWVARPRDETPEDAIAFAARMRARRIPCDVLALDAPSASGPREALRLRSWDPERLPDPPATLSGKDQAAQPEGLRVQLAGVTVRLRRIAAVPGPRRTAIPADDAGRRPVSVRARRRARHGCAGRPVPGRRPRAASSTSRIPPPTTGGATRMNCCSQPASTSSTDGGEHVPDHAVAFNGDGGHRLHNVYALLYNRCIFEATAKFRPRRWSAVHLGRVGWAGSQRYRWAWRDPQSDWEGLAASLRGGLSWGMSGNPYHGRHRRLLWRAAHRGTLRALAASDGVRLAHARARRR